MRKTLIFFLLLFAVYSNAQQTQRGRCFELQNGDTSNIPGVLILGSSRQVISVSDAQGAFNWPKDSLITGVKIPGYRLKRVKSPSAFLWLELVQQTTQLEAVEIIFERSDIELSQLSIQKSEVLGAKYLMKAACCNLSESFETNPSIDVNFTDALTGAKQIQMLGLAGPYALITKENMPYLRGLSGSYGLAHIPGAWIQSIQMSKGAGSVLNGFDSFSGQINTELYAPENAPSVLWNTYLNENLRNEYNLVLKPSKTLIPMVILAHVSINPLQEDLNRDGFADIPIGEQYQCMPKFSYQQGGFEMQFGAGFLQDTKYSGQLGAIYNGSGAAYRIGIQQQKQELFAKAGYVFLKHPGTSLGSQFSYSTYQINLNNGSHAYTGNQQTSYMNIIFQGIFNTTAHAYKTGISMLQNTILEQYKQTFNRLESVPGCFTEYQYTPHDRFSVISGIRADFHNWYGIQISPRLHLKYTPNSAITIRASGGRAFKSNYIFSEQMGYFSSSRIWAIDSIPVGIITGLSNSMPYGLHQEQAWNYGINLQWRMRWFERDAFLLFEAYQTRFEQQVLPDMFNSKQYINFYNVRGSYAHSIQSEMRCEPFKRFHIMSAYRYVENKAPYSGQFRDVPFISKHRAYFNISYETRLKHWFLDATLQWHGSKIIPNLNGTFNKSPDFAIVLSQITYKWYYRQHESDAYIGVENLTNVKQNPAVWSADSPYSNRFDANRIWGPIYGRMLYFGIRYKHR